jgi:hypothetical protein
VTVFLHVGFPKTGTTSIQRTLFSYAKALRDNHSVNYPDFQSNHWPIALPFYSNQAPLSLHENAVRDGKGTEARYKRMSQKFWTEIQATSALYEHHILSSEGFCSLNSASATGLRRRLESLGHPVKVVIYVRHPADHFSSRIAQNVVSGSRRLNNIFDVPNQYDEEFYRIVEVYGRGNLIVRRFGQQYFEQGDLIADFFIGTLGRVIPGIVPKVHNEGLSLPATLILDRLNGMSPRFSKDRAPTHYLKKIAGPKFLAPRAAVEAYVENNRGFMAYLDREFGVRFDEVDMGKFPESLSYELSEETLTSLADVLNNQAKRLSRTSSRRKLTKWAKSLWRRPPP